MSSSEHMVPPEQPNRRDPLPELIGGVVNLPSRTSALLRRIRRRTPRAVWRLAADKEEEPAEVAENVQHEAAVISQRIEEGFQNLRPHERAKAWLGVTYLGEKVKAENFATIRLPRSQVSNLMDNLLYQMIYDNEILPTAKPFLDAGKINGEDSDEEVSLRFIIPTQSNLLKMLDTVKDVSGVKVLFEFARDVVNLGNSVMPLDSDARDMSDMEAGDFFCFVKGVPEEYEHGPIEKFLGRYMAADNLDNIQSFTLNNESPGETLDALESAYETPDLWIGDQILISASLEEADEEKLEGFVGQAVGMGCQIVRGNDSLYVFIPISRGGIAAELAKSLGNIAGVPAFMQKIEMHNTVHGGAQYIEEKRRLGDAFTSQFFGAPFVVGPDLKDEVQESDGELASLTASTGVVRGQTVRHENFGEVLIGHDVLMPQRFRFYGFGPEGVYGRGEDIRKIREVVLNRSAGLAFVHGEQGIGKTTIIETALRGIKTFKMTFSPLLAYTEGGGIVTMLKSLQAEIGALIEQFEVSEGLEDKLIYIDQWASYEDDDLREKCHKYGISPDDFRLFAAIYEFNRMNLDERLEALEEDGLEHWSEMALFAMQKLAGEGIAAIWPDNIETVYPADMNAILETYEKMRLAGQGQNLTMVLGLRDDRHYQWPELLPQVAANLEGQGLTPIALPLKRMDPAMQANDEVSGQPYLVFHRYCLDALARNLGVARYKARLEAGKSFCLGPRFQELIEASGGNPRILNALLGCFFNAVKKKESLLIIDDRDTECFLDIDGEYDISTVGDEGDLRGVFEGQLKAAALPSDDLLALRVLSILGSAIRPAVINILLEHFGVTNHEEILEELVQDRFVVRVLDGEGERYSVIDPLLAEVVNNQLDLSSKADFAQRMFDELFRRNLIDAETQVQLLGNVAEVAAPYKFEGDEEAPSENQRNDLFWGTIKMALEESVERTKKTGDQAKVFKKAFMACGFDRLIRMEAGPHEAVMVKVLRFLQEGGDVDLLVGFKSFLELALKEIAKNGFHVGEFKAAAKAALILMEISENVPKDVLFYAYMAAVAGLKVSLYEDEELYADARTLRYELKACHDNQFTLLMGEDYFLDDESYQVRKGRARKGLAAAPSEAYGQALEERWLKLKSSVREGDASWAEIRRREIVRFGNDMKRRYVGHSGMMFYPGALVGGRYREVAIPLWSSIQGVAGKEFGPREQISILHVKSQLELAEGKFLEAEKTIRQALRITNRHNQNHFTTVFLNRLMHTRRLRATLVVDDSKLNKDGGYKVEAEVREHANWEGLMGALDTGMLDLLPSLSKSSGSSYELNVCIEGLLLSEEICKRLFGYIRNGNLKAFDLALPKLLKSLDFASRIVKILEGYRGKFESGNMPDGDTKDLFGSLGFILHVLDVALLRAPSDSWRELSQMRFRIKNAMRRIMVPRQIEVARNEINERTKRKEGVYQFGYERFQSELEGVALLERFMERGDMDGEFPIGAVKGVRSIQSGLRGLKKLKRPNVSIFERNQAPL